MYTWLRGKKSWYRDVIRRPGQDSINFKPLVIFAFFIGGFSRWADNVVNAKHRQVVVEISDERVEWRVRNRKQFIESKFLYTLNGQNTSHGRPDYFVYAGFNRVVAGSFRNGSGLCRAMITLHADKGQQFNINL